MIHPQRYLVWYAIAGYRRWLSPYKGFRCAAATLHGGNSCSRAIQDIVLQKGPWRGRRAIRERFALCRMAAQQLRERRASQASQHEQDDPNGPPHQPRKHQRHCWLNEIGPCCVGPGACGGAVATAPLGGSSASGGSGGAGPAGGIGAPAGGAGDVVGGAGDGCSVPDFSLPDCSLPDCSCGG